MIIFITILCLFVVSVTVFIRENERHKRIPGVYGWTILLLASALSLGSFLVNSLTEINQINMDTIVAGVVFIGNTVGLIIIVGYLLTRKKKNLSLNKVDKFSLIMCGIIISFWIFSKDAFSTNILLQALMLTGYILLINNIIKQKKNSESFLFWSLSLTGSALSFIPAYEKNSILAIINSWRAFVSVVVILSVMLYYKQRNKII